jgi:hypothetical protein
MCGISLLRGLDQKKKLAYVLQPMAILDVYSVVSVIAVSIQSDLWLPFTFLR